MGADLTRANARAGVARSNAARLSQLAREGIIAGARADEANALAAEAGADVAEKASILKMVNGVGASGTYTLTAPIAGRVTTASVPTGNPVDGTTRRESVVEGKRCDKRVDISSGRVNQKKKKSIKK